MIIYDAFVIAPLKSADFNPNQIVFLFFKSICLLDKSYLHLKASLFNNKKTSSIRKYFGYIFTKKILNDTSNKKGRSVLATFINPMNICWTRKIVTSTSPHPSLYNYSSIS